MLEMILLPLLWGEPVLTGPSASASPVPTVWVRGVLLDERGAPARARVLHVGSLDGRKAIVQLREQEILNPTGTTDGNGRFAILVPVAFFAAAKAFTVGTVRADGAVPEGAAQLPLLPVKRNGEVASFDYKGQRAALELGDVHLPSDDE